MMANVKLPFLCQCNYKLITGFLKEMSEYLPEIISTFVRLFSTFSLCGIRQNIKEFFLKCHTANWTHSTVSFSLFYAQKTLHFLSAVPLFFTQRHIYHVMDFEATL